jgi:hypothetical protein
MSTPFDAYHKWLGIPPDQQPAHHYRLLGIGLFESDADVIEAAANQRTAYLQELAAGEHVELTQKLLNEISRARRCLLNPEQRQAYDVQLRRSIAPAAKEEAGQDPTATAINKTPAHLVGVSIAASIVLIVVLIVVLSRGDGQGGNAGEFGELRLRWEINERQGAVLEIDGENITLPPDQEIKVTLKKQPRFRHRIVMQRAGFKTIELNRVVTPDDRTIFKPNWQKQNP